MVDNGLLNTVIGLTIFTCTYFYLRVLLRDTVMLRGLPTQASIFFAVDLSAGGVGVYV